MEKGGDGTQYRVNPWPRSRLPREIGFSFLSLFPGDAPPERELSPIEDILADLDLDEATNDAPVADFVLLAWPTAGPVQKVWTEVPGRKAVLDKKAKAKIWSYAE